ATRPAQPTRGGSSTVRPPRLGRGDGRPAALPRGAGAPGPAGGAVARPAVSAPGPAAGRKRPQPARGAILGPSLARRRTRDRTRGAGSGPDRARGPPRASAGGPLLDGGRRDRGGDTRRADTLRAPGGR